MKLEVGTLIRTLKGEQDQDGNGNVRVTPPGTLGRVTEVVEHPECAEGERVHHHVTFADKAWVILFESEVGDEDQYEIYRYPSVPEHEKMKVAKEKLGLDAVVNFLEWLDEKPWRICEYDGGAVTMGIEKLLALYAGIDLKKVSLEKDALLAWQRLCNEARE